VHARFLHWHRIGIECIPFTTYFSAWLLRQMAVLNLQPLKNRFQALTSLRLPFIEELQEVLGAQGASLFELSISLAVKQLAVARQHR
jgi:hypothetical protein